MAVRVDQKESAKLKLKKAKNAEGGANNVAALKGILKDMREAVEDLNERIEKIEKQLGLK